MPHFASPFVTASDAHPIRSRPPPREIGRFAETSSVRWLRRVFAVLNRTAPSASARLAYALLTRPPRVPERAWEAAIRAQAHTSALPFGTGRLAVYEWGTGPAVLLVHGWGARATHFGKLVPALVASGGASWPSTRLRMAAPAGATPRCPTLLRRWPRWLDMREKSRA